MSNVTYMYPEDDPNDEFNKWFIDIMKDLDDPYSSYADEYEYDESFYNKIKEIYDAGY